MENKSDIAITDVSQFIRGKIGDKFGLNMIIATGGGAVINPTNLLALKKNGMLICLTASIDVILSRIGSGDERPLISEGDKKETISNLLKAREPFYKKADFIVDTTRKSIKEVVKEVLKIVETSLSPLP